MHCHAHAKNMCLHNVLQTIAEPPTQRDGTLYSNFNREICSQHSEKTPHIHPLCMCLLRGQGPRILDICTFAKCCTMCSLRPAHSSKARLQLTCAARNSSWCEAMNQRNCCMPYVARSLTGRASKRPWSNNNAHSSTPLGSIIARPSLMLASNTSVTART